MDDFRIPNALPFSAHLLRKNSINNSIKVFTMVNKCGETAYTISLRNQTSECARVIEELAELDRQQNGKKARKVRE